jgi:uncharacterized protein (DUF983 family)
MYCHSVTGLSYKSTSGTDTLVGWLAAHVVVLHMLLIDKAVGESRWVMMIFVLQMLYLTLIDTSLPLPQTKQRQML